MCLWNNIYRILFICDEGIIIQTYTWYEIEIKCEHIYCMCSTESYNNEGSYQNINFQMFEN